MRDDLSVQMKMDRSTVSVVALSHTGDERAYWGSKTPVERIQHMEILREINYGDAASRRLQRIFEVVKRA